MQSKPTRKCSPKHTCTAIILRLRTYGDHAEPRYKITVNGPGENAYGAENQKEAHCEEKHTPGIRTIMVIAGMFLLDSLPALCDRLICNVSRRNIPDLTIIFLAVTRILLIRGFNNEPSRVLASVPPQRCLRHHYDLVVNQPARMRAPVPSSSALGIQIREGRHQIKFFPNQHP